MIRQARALGLDGMAITDHNSLGGAGKAYKAAREMDGFVVLRGLEISARHGHVLAYGVSEEVPRDLSCRETTERVIALGGVPVAAHPFRFWSGLGEEETLSGKFAAYEVQNARTKRRQNRHAADLAVQTGVGRTGGSDAHFLDEIGRSHTLFEDVETEAELLEQLARHTTKAEGSDRCPRGTLRYVPKAVGEWMRRGMKRI